MPVDNPLPPDHVSSMSAFYRRIPPFLPLLVLAGSQTVEAAGPGATDSYRYPMTLFLLACVFLGVGMIIGVVTKRHPVGALLLSLLGPIGWVILLLHKPQFIPEGSSRHHRHSRKPPEPPAPPPPPITRSIAALKKENETH